MLRCLRRDPARVHKKASRDLENGNVPVRDDGERTKPADPFSTLNLGEGKGEVSREKTEVKFRMVWWDSLGIL